MGQHPGDRQAEDPHLRRHARVVRRDPGLRAALHGYYPPIKGNRPEILFDLYKPFDIFAEQTEEEKSRGRLVEVNNGRAAQLAIIALLSESKGLVVPPLDYIEGFPKYSGDCMVPFEGQFHTNEALGAWTEATLAR